MEIRHLSHLLAIIEAGSLGKAAKVVGVSEPALSKSIKRLEDCVGVKLLERTPLGVVPTAFGQSLAKNAKIIKSEVERAYFDLGALAGLNEGLVRIGTDASFTTFLLPKAITALRESRPGIRVVVERAAPEELRSMVVHGSVDLITASLSTLQLDADLAVEVLMEDESLLLVGKDHPLNHIEVVTPEMLSEYGWILPSRSHYMRRKIEDLLSSRGLHSPNVVIESDNVQLTKHCLIQSDLIGFLSSQNTYNYRNLPLLQPLRVEGFSSTDKLGAVKRRRAGLSPVAKELLRQLRAACVELRAQPAGPSHVGRAVRVVSHG